MVKPRLYLTDDKASKDAALWTLQTVLIGSLKLLHPYMPFITEEIFCNLQSREESIMISKWPVWREDFNYPEEEKAVGLIKDAVTEIRKMRTERGVAPSRKAKVYLVSQDAEIRRIFDEDRLFFERLAGASDVVLQENAEGVPEGAVSVILPFATFFLPLQDLMDVSTEIARLEKELQRLDAELARSAKMLGNERFLAKAPKAKIEEETLKQQNYRQQRQATADMLEQMKKLQ